MSTPNKLLILCCTNRPGNRTSYICDIYKDIATKYWDEITFASLEMMNAINITGEMYQKSYSDPIFDKLQTDIFDPAQYIIFVIPEYNGTFPGIFKLFIDIVSIKHKEKSFLDKYVAMVGVSSGRAGNLRGLDQITNALNYLGMHVYKNKLPISSIEQVLSNDALLESTKQALETHAKGFREMM